MTIRSVINTVKRALQSIRRPTLGISRVLRRQAANAFGRMGTSFHRAQSALLEAELHLPADVARSDLLSALSDAGKVDLVSRFDPTAILPTSLMTEATLKEDRRYLSIYKVKIRYAQTSIATEKYISGYFNELSSSEDWFRRLEQMITPGTGETKYDILEYNLVNVKHQKGESY